MGIDPMTASNSRRQNLMEQGEINDSTITAEEVKSSTTLHQNQAGGKTVRTESN